MKVVVRTLGRDASVADWLTKLFQAIIVSPSVCWRRYSDGSERARGGAPERLIPLQSDCCQVSPRGQRRPGLRCLFNGAGQRVRIQSAPREYGWKDELDCAWAVRRLNFVQEGERIE